ncbi:MAG: acyl-CoA thioesterase [Flavobacteriaceae bacterium]|nr:acyl-CoA thioesterase [Flavobacteriaceae bacterium]
MNYKLTFKTRWADFDPNNHMRHSAYNDYAAETRVRYFKDCGYSLSELNKQNLGPVLFSENTIFYREITLSEDISVTLLMKGLSENGERFKFQHKICKQDGVLAAIIEVYGAWLDLSKRKLTLAPNQIFSDFNQLEKTEDFETILINEKSN